MTEKRLSYLLGMSIVLVILSVGCGTREERITLAASTGAALSVSPSAGSATAAGSSSTAPTVTATPSPSPAASPSVLSGRDPQEGVEPEAQSATPQATPTRISRPEATPTPVTFGPPQDGMEVVTLSRHGSIALLRPGDRLVLTFGDGYRWTLHVSGGSVLVPLGGIALPPGTQAVFVAQDRGRSTISARGEPICRDPSTGCTEPPMAFNLRIIVQ